MGSYLKRVNYQSGSTPDGEISKIIRDVISDATAGPFSGLKYEGEFPKTGFGITNLRARDVAQSNQTSGLQGGVAGSGVWGVTAVTASTWTDWINLAIDDRLYIIVTGFFNRSTSPTITRLRFRANGEDLPSVDLEGLYNLSESLVLLEQPFAVKPGNNFTARVFTEKTIAGAPAERIGLTGFAVAKRAYLIAE